MKINACTFGSLAGVALVLLGVAACNSDDADDTVVEASRAQRIDSLADTACDRYEDTSAGCPGYGSGDGQKYANEDACENDFKQKAENLWPVARCNDGQIDAARYDACVARVKSFACSTGGQNFLDGISALSECSADNVCVDNP